MAEPRDEDDLERREPDDLERTPEHPDAPHRDEDDDDDEAPKGRLALSHEIAQRWDPEKLTKAISKRGGGGQALDALTRSRYEQKFGVDLGDVRVYSGEF